MYPDKKKRLGRPRHEIIALFQNKNVNVLNFIFAGKDSSKTKFKTLWNEEHNVLRYCALSLPLNEFLEFNLKFGHFDLRLMSHTSICYINVQIKIMYLFFVKDTLNNYLKLKSWTYLDMFYAFLQNEDRFI